MNSWSTWAPLAVIVVLAIVYVGGQAVVSESAPQAKLENSPIIAPEPVDSGGDELALLEGSLRRMYGGGQVLPVGSGSLLIQTSLYDVSELESACRKLGQVVQSTVPDRSAFVEFTLPSGEKVECEKIEAGAGRPIDRLIRERSQQ